jgi:hypothetical protein
VSRYDILIVAKEVNSNCNKKGAEKKVAKKIKKS